MFLVKSQAIYDCGQAVVVTRVESSSYSC